MYGVSKLCEATYSRVLAQQLKPKGIDVTACCPGYVNTDMSSHRGVKTPAQVGILDWGALSTLWSFVDKDTLSHYRALVGTNATRACS